MLFYAKVSRSANVFTLLDMGVSRGFNSIYHVLVQAYKGEEVFFARILFLLHYPLPFIRLLRSLVAAKNGICTLCA